MIMAFIVVGHVGALMLVLVLPMPLALQIGLTGLIGVSLRRSWQVHVFSTFSELRVEEDGSCQCKRMGVSQLWSVARAVVYAGFVRLTLKSSNGKTHTLLIARDAIEPEQNRVLRANIRQRRLPVVDQFVESNS